MKSVVDTKKLARFNTSESKATHVQCARLTFCHGSKHQRSSGEGSEQKTYTKISKKIKERLVKKLFGWSRKNSAAVNPLIAQATAPMDLSCIFDLADGDESRTYFYRTESSSGWQRFFTEDFEITLRSGKSQDAAMNKELRQAAAATGKVRAFYYYADPAYVAEQVTNFHKDAVLKAYGWIADTAHYRSLCLVARYNINSPALDCKPNYKDGTQNSNVCRYVITDPKDYIIHRDDIEIYLCGAWRKLPNHDDRTLLNLLKDLEKEGAYSRKSTWLLMNILRFQ